MGKTNKNENICVDSDSKIYKSPEAIEQEMISLAVKQAKHQLENMTAPASTVNYYLKLGSSRERIEREVIQNQATLLQAKADSIEEGKSEKQAYLDAIEAIKNYGGSKLPS